MSAKTEFNIDELPVGGTLEIWTGNGMRKLFTRSADGLYLHYYPAPEPKKAYSPYGYPEERVRCWSIGSKRDGIEKPGLIAVGYRWYFTTTDLVHPSNISTYECGEILRMDVT